MEFHCSRLGADGVAANFEGSWKAWGQIDPASVSLKKDGLETAYDLMERVGLGFTPLGVLGGVKNPVTGEIVEMDTKAVFNGNGDKIGEVGRDFALVSHWDTCKAIFGKMIEMETIPARFICFDGGAKMIAQFLIPKAYQGAGREHRGFASVWNGLDGKLRTRLGESVYTPVCSNTKAAMIAELEGQAKHTKNYTVNLSKVAKAIAIVRDNLDSEMAQFDKWGLLPVSQSTVDQFVGFLMPKVEDSKSKAVDNRQGDLKLAIAQTTAEIGTRTTAYDLFGGLTRYVAGRQQNRNGNEQFEYVTMGAGSDFIQKGANWLADYVGR